jgi:NADH-quinone oxidoreductase subunit G
MPTITIDGQTFEFEGKKTILQVALENGIEIPHYCYHPAMSVVASCRICLAEVAQPNPKNDNKIELIPKLLPTCQTPAQDQQIVHTESPKAIANQKAVMEYLLINHPIDCPVCDQAGECYLQDYSYKYGRAASRFEETKIKQPKKDLGQHVLLYSDRCIMCSRCVRFTREVTGTGEIATFGRGADEQIDVFPGKPLNNELSGNVVDICPVGALLDKDFLMSMRVWNLRKTASIDGITASGDNLSIEHNDGKVYRLKPRINMEVNTWWISDEIRYGWKHIHSPERLRTPWRKAKGAMEECDWNQAYRQVTDQFQQTVKQHGEGSLAAMISPMLPSEEAYALGQFILGMDPQATLGIGPVPFEGENKTFPGGYTVWAEKAPNARGVRRALELLTSEVHDYDQWLARLGSGESNVQAVLLTGNYPSNWVTPSLKNAMHQRYVALIDILPSELSEEVDLLMPGASWAEKAGTFENIHNRLQSFDQAIPVIELAKTEGQIALDLMGFAGLQQRRPFKAAELRQAMGEPFVSEVHHPEAEHRVTSELEYVPL